MRWRSLATLALAAGLSLNVLRADDIVFSSSFTSESAAYDPINNPWSTLNFTNFNSWNVTKGSVDLVNLNGAASSLWFYNYHGAKPANSFVDLDGTTMQSGQITTKNGINLTPGNYQLTFDVSGNLGRRPNAEGVTVRLDGLGISQHYELASNAGFDTKTIDFTVTTPTTTNLSFANKSADPSTMNDEQGPLVGNINLTNLSAGIASVPEPATFILGVGLAGGLLLARRFRRQAKVKTV